MKTYAQWQLWRRRWGSLVCGQTESRRPGRGQSEPGQSNWTSSPPYLRARNIPGTAERRTLNVRTAQQEIQHYYFTLFISFENLSTWRKTYDILISQWTRSKYTNNTAFRKTLTRLCLPTWVSSAGSFCSQSKACMCICRSASLSCGISFFLSCLCRDRRTCLLQ